MAGINAIIFDLGGVLIDWNPRYVFDNDYFDTIEKRDYFLKNICTDAWNENQDAGYPIAKATEEKIAIFPEWEKAIRDYYGRWPKMLHGQIQETVDIFRELKKNPQLKIYALTNWSAETFPIALERFDFLQWFDGLTVSGVEKTRKPFPEFYQLLLNRYNVKPQEALLIDDNLRNVKAGELLGIQVIHYKNAIELRHQLINLKLL
jgi:2-haloacid dehalogenase